MAKVKIGVVGCGVMGALHIKTSLLLNKDEKFIGFYDPDEQRSKEISEKFNIIAFSSFEELLKNSEALIIATPTSTHFETAKKAIEAQKHTLIEKPLTMNAFEAEELLNLAKEQKKVLAVGMIERFNPAFSKVFSITRKEKILGMDIKRFSPYPQRISDANVIWDMMIHDIDLACLLAKAEIDSIKVTYKKSKSKNLLDEVVCVLYFKDGTIAKISSSRLKDYKFRQVQITTDKFVYDLDLLNKKLHKKAFEDLAQKVEIEVQAADQLILEHKDFLKAIRNNTEPSCTGTQALKIIKTIEEVLTKC